MVGKHTPGPWSIQRHTWVDKRFYIDGETAFGNPIGMVYYDDCDYEEQDENARLIAAAPDLLAACEAALELILAEYTDGAEDDCDCPSCRVRDKLKAAVKLAKEGNSSGQNMYI